MKEWLLDFGLQLVVKTVLPKLIKEGIPDDMIVEKGISHGKMITNIGRKNYKDWNSVENLVQPKIRLYFTSVEKGVDFDD